MKGSSHAVLTRLIIGRYFNSELIVTFCEGKVCYFLFIIGLWHNIRVLIVESLYVIYLLYCLDIPMSCWRNYVPGICLIYLFYCERIIFIHDLLCFCYTILRFYRYDQRFIVLFIKHSVLKALIWPINCVFACFINEVFYIYIYMFN